MPRVKAKKQEETEQAVTVAAEPTVIETFKGFNRDLTCRDFKYEMGQTYTTTAKVVRCAEGGFHSCSMPLDVWNYYGPATSRFALTEVSGAIDRDESGDTKIASAIITIKAELKLPEMIRRAAAWVMARADKNMATGYSGHAAATGNSGHAAATGDRGHAAVKGKNAIAASLGYAATAQASVDGWIVLAAYDNDRNLVCVRAAKVGGPEGIEPHVAYRLTVAGEFVKAEG